MESPSCPSLHLLVVERGSFSYAYKFEGNDPSYAGEYLCGARFPNQIIKKKNIHELRNSIQALRLSLQLYTRSCVWE